MSKDFFKGMAFAAGAISLTAVAAVAVVKIVEKYKEKKAEDFEFECCCGDCEEEDDSYIDAPSCGCHDDGCGCDDKDTCDDECGCDSECTCDDTPDEKA